MKGRLRKDNHPNYSSKKLILKLNYCVLGCTALHAHKDCMIQKIIAPGSSPPSPLPSLKGKEEEKGKRGYVHFFNHAV